MLAFLGRVLARAVKVSRRDTLDRYYLLSFRGWAVFLHRIKQSDPPGVMHTHPWPWWSVVLGSYRDHRVGTERRVVGWNSCEAGVPHRVTVRRPTWTLLLHSPRKCRWAVTDEAGNVVEEEPWTGTDKPDRKGYVKGGARVQADL